VLNEKNITIIFIYLGHGSIENEKIFEILPKLFISLIKNKNETNEFKNGIEVFFASQFFKKFKIINFFNENNKKLKFNIGTFFNSNLIVKNSKLILSHGGLNSILQCIYFNKPIFIFPGLMHERRFNAMWVKNLKIGNLIEFEDFNENYLFNLFINFNFKNLEKKIKKISNLYFNENGSEKIIYQIFNWYEKNFYNFEFKIIF
jgi:UDP-N-acetylglucosamine:LPS N-acetylglucosamine transferase